MSLKSSSYPKTHYEVTHREIWWWRGCELQLNPLFCKHFILCFMCSKISMNHTWPNFCSKFRYRHREIDTSFVILRFWLEFVESGSLYKVLLYTHTHMSIKKIIHNQTLIMLLRNQQRNPWRSLLPKPELIVLMRMTMMKTRWDSILMVGSICAQLAHFSFQKPSTFVKVQKFG